MDNIMKLQQELIEMDGEITAHIKTLSGKHTRQQSIDDLAEGVARLRELLRARDSKVDLLNEAREQVKS